MLTLQVHEKEIEITSFEEFVRGTVGKTCQINLDEFWATIQIRLFLNVAVVNL